MKREGIVCLFFMALLIFMLAKIEGCIQKHRDTSPDSLLVEVRIDTLWIHDTLHVYHPAVIRELTRPVPAEVDTAAILASHFMTRVYADTLRIADVATVHISDSVSENRLQSRSIDWVAAQLEPVVTVTKPPNVVTPRLALSTGVQLGTKQATVVVGLRIKRAELLAGYDLRLHTPNITLKYDIWQWQ